MIYVETRILGRSGIRVSAMGLGCWAIGGQFYLDNKNDGWGNVDDEESIRAIQCALDMGISFIDTADAYGVGHSEEVIGRAIARRRDQVVLATKFGFFGNEATRTLHGTNLAPDYIERACDASLRRLNTDYIDLYQLHVWEVKITELEKVCNTLDRLVGKGKIRAFGWSTDMLGGAKLIAQLKNCAAIQQKLNILEGSEELLRFCEQENLASINRSPLAMGLLTGKFNASTKLPKEDVRGAGFSWVNFFRDGKPSPEALAKLDAVREILTSRGRTLAQGALAWIWARSGNTIPIPGFKSIEQVQENAAAMEYGPLTDHQIREIEEVLA